MLFGKTRASPKFSFFAIVVKTPIDLPNSLLREEEIIYVAHNTFSQIHKIEKFIS